jgi:hypothetical protein
VQDPNFVHVTQRQQTRIGNPNTCEHHDRQCHVGTQPSEHTTEGETVKTWHLKVGDKTVSAVGQNDREGRLTVRRHDNIETAASKHDRDEFAEVDIVVSHDDTQRRRFSAAGDRRAMRRGRLLRRRVRRRSDPAPDSFKDPHGDFCAALDCQSVHPRLSNSGLDPAHAESGILESHEHAGDTAMPVGHCQNEIGVPDVYRQHL